MVPVLLPALRASPSPAFGVLSAYLPTPPVQVSGQKYLVRFREECKPIREELEAARRDERQAFETAADRIEEYLGEMPTPRHPGLAVFAAAERGYLYAVPLPDRPATVVVWDTEPILAPLEEVLDEHERVGVVLTDKRQARLFTVYLGAIEEKQVLVSADPGKSNVSGIAGNYTRHYQENVRRHLRRTVHAATELLRARPFDRLILGGPADVDTMLRDELSRPLRTRFAGIVPIGLEASDAEVLDAVRVKAEEIERRTEREMVEELISAQTTPRVALGPQDTIDALNDDRVHHLFLTSEVAGGGARCPICGRLEMATDRCPTHGVQLEPVPDLRERLIDRALEQAARVESVSGEAADLLAEHDGIGAWTRY
jgi:peptide subunit release factor 1 (eRF1)